MSIKSSVNCILVLLCLLPCFGKAQNQLKDEIIRFDEGLPSDFVRQVALSKNGYLYLATRRGLSQYDGYRFLEQPAALTNITSLLVKDDVIYYHDVYNGLCVLKNFYDKPSVITTNKYHDTDPNNDHFENIFVDSEDRIWCTDFNNIKYFNRDGTKGKVFFVDKNPDKIKRYVTFLELQKGVVWALTNRGMFIWQKQTGKLIPQSNAKLRNLEYRAALQINKEEVLFSTLNGRLIKYNLVSKQISDMPSLPDNRTIVGIGKVTVGGQPQTLLYSDQSVYLLSETDLKPKLLYSTERQIINEVIVNNETKIIWIATNKGLVKLFNPYSSISNAMLPLDSQRPGNMILDIVELPNGEIYTCGRDNVLWIYNKTSGWRKLMLPEKDVKCESLSLAGNKILVSTNVGVFCVEDENVKKLVALALPPKWPIKKSIVYQDKQLWVLPAGQPVQVYKWPSLEKENGFVTNDNQFWSDNLWNDIYINADGKIWLVGWMPKDFGLAIYNESKKAFLEVSKLKENADHSQFCGDYYNRISTTTNGDVLVSGYGGWNLLDANGVIKKMLNTQTYDVANDRVEGIAEDNNGKVWFATEEGLNVYNNNTDKVIRISQIDGLPGDDLIYGFKKLRNGNLVVGVENGLSFIDVNKIVRSQLVNKLELCGIKVNGKTINTNNPDIELKKGETELELLFSSLTFIDKRKIIYRYKFKDETKWIYLGNKAELSLRHLAPGDYHLQIEVGDNMENWQSKDLVVKVYLPAPFYKTQWFLFLMFGLIILGIVYVYRYLFQQHKIEEQYRRKLKDAEMQALRSQMNPHFMFNTLNSINSFIIEHKIEEASEYLTTFSKLMRNILDNSKHTAISLDKELDTLKLYLNLEAARLEHCFDYSIKFNKDIHPESLRVPPLILQPFAENAIWHGLRNKDGKGLLEIIIEQTNESILHITIKDNGIGRAAAGSFMASQFKHKSYGVDITSSRLKLLSSDSQIVTEDLYDGDKAVGTAVHIYLNMI
ncbi:histidine kinase [Pedobacter foliorum]|uniref:sensor histidine kinase n=1 Tax=Pedobacter foliorum TaxID=2739058 RepID=UPI001563D948|nr:histidine kinase [Pedobacter foliorum]NRF41043.1 histidine kinase [Pedobacter foliorum]